jgi:hypothetical protein
MRAKTYKLLALFGMMVVLTVANAARTNNVLAQDTSFAPLVTNASQCTVIVQPGQSIQAAVVPARSGAVICVRAGVYSEQVKLKAKNTGVTLMSYPGEKAIIDGRNQIPAVTAKNTTPPLIMIDAVNVTVEGFEVRNSKARGVTISKSNVTVRNMVIRDNQSMGLVVTVAGSVPVRNVLVENNIVHNNLLRNANGTAGGSGLAFTQQVEYSVARGNVISHNYGEGLVAGRYTRNLTFEDNTSYDNRGANIYLVNTTNVTVRRNFVFCTNDPISWRGTGGQYRPGPGLQVRDEDFKSPPPPSTGQVIVNNIVVGCGVNFGVSTQINGGGLNNAVVANNTFVNARSVSGDAANNVEFDGRASFQNTRFTNNLIVQTVPGTITRIQYATGTPNLSSFTVSNNLYSKNPVNGWPSSEAGRIVADPRLASLVLPMMNALPTPANYILLAGSPAVDRGANVAHVTDDFFGTARNGALDIGADELGGSTTFTILGDLLPLVESSN